MNKYIKLSLNTFLGLMMIVSFVFGSIFIANPVKAGEFFEDIEMHNFAYASYNVAYRNTEELSDQHRMIRMSIDHKNEKNIIYYTEKLLANNTSSTVDSYDKFIFEIDEIARTHYAYDRYKEENVATRETSNNNLIAVASEDAYLKRQYISALIKVGRINEAFDFAKAEQIKATNMLRTGSGVPAGEAVYYYTSFYFAEFDSSVQLRAETEILAYYNALKTRLRAEVGRAYQNPNIEFGWTVLLNMLNLNNTIFKVAYMFDSIYEVNEIYGHKFGEDMEYCLAAQKELARAKVVHADGYNGPLARRSVIDWVML